MRVSLSRDFFALLLVAVTMLAHPVSTADDALKLKFREVTGNPYPSDFQLRDQAGNLWQLSKNLGRVIVINFWATWCAPCLKELPSMNDLSNFFSDVEFMLLAINVGEEPSEIKKFIQTFEPPLSFPILSDPNMQVVGEWGVRGVPTSYIIDRHGRFFEFAEGEIDFTDSALVGKLRGLLNEKR